MSDMPSLPSTKRAEPQPLVIDQVGARAPADEPAVDTDTRKPLRYGLLALAIGFGGFMLWAVTAPLASGVPAPGVVSVESQRKSVQHFSGGIVEEIRVREGQEVKAGDVLLVLNATRARAELGIVRAQYLAARAIEDRLTAEYANRPAIRFSPELLAQRDDPAVAEIIEVQQRLFDTRRASQKKELAVLRESEAALNTQLVALRELAREGYYPRNRMLDAERSSAEIRLRILTQEQEYRKEVESQLGDAQRDAAGSLDRLRAAQEELARTEIKAPVDGIVLGLSVHTVGAVIPSGGRVLDIVPRDEPLIVEAQVPPHLIDQVHAGMDSDLHFTAFDRNRTPVISGHVDTVSADRLTDPASHLSYYLARITVPAKEVKRLGNSRIQPGMPVDVILKGEPRTFMNYLLKPLRDRFSAALKER